MARTKTPRTNGTAVKKQIATAEVISIPEVTPTPTADLTLDLQSEIRQRAYQLYVERGCTPGHENDDWLLAEREVRSRHDHRQNVA